MNKDTAKETTHPLQPGDWVKFKGHNRYGRIKSVESFKFRTWENLITEKSGSRRDYTPIMPGDYVYTVFRMTKRGGKYVLEEQRWHSKHTEAIEPSDNRVSIWAVTIMQQ